MADRATRTASHKYFSSRYIIGIDLGTTHTVVSFVDTQRADQSRLPEVFPVDQLVAPGEVAARPLLPSFRYHPLAEEIARESSQLPWSAADFPDELEQVVIGSWARQLGAAVAGRLVVSAKSWLSHSQVDRQADILPWDGESQITKVSPILASASYLHHVRQAWNYHHPQELLEHQQLVITVPASFDESARALTVRAAELAGLRQFVLLEEPQAVVYDWFARNRDMAARLLQGVRLLLVCDIGGGTTDLSLIQVNYDNNELSLSRVGVGDHLMLGGDNIDLALAHRAEIALGLGGKNLNTARLAQLIQQCRQAKEVLLADNAPETATVTLMGSGSKLIGNASKCSLSREEVHALVLDGFFPLTSFEQRPARRAAAIVEFGLPYASDPAISKYLAEFLGKHQQLAMSPPELAETAKTRTSDVSDPDNLNSPHMLLPEAILLNGGVFNSSQIARRVTALLNHWRSNDLPPVQVLDNPHADLAVAFGAAAYGVARRYQQMKISGGSARSFFLVLDDGQQTRRGVCVLPKGTEENQEILLADHRFELRLGQPVKFSLATTTSDEVFQPGEIHQLGADFLQLPPLLAVLDQQPSETDEVQGDRSSELTNLASNNLAMTGVEVNLLTSLTEVGTIEMYCIAAGDCMPVGGSDQRWKLEFEIRKSTPTDSRHNDRLPAQSRHAIDKIDAVYGPKRKTFDPQAIRTLRNDLLKILGKREDWPTHLLRELFNALLERKKNRIRSEAHERVWFNLAGFCLRPGFGDPLDEWRIEQLWPLYQQGPHYPQSNQNWSEWWVFWRRLAGGLNSQQQQSIYQDIAKYINPTVLRNRQLLAELKQKSYEDMLRLMASLEHLPVAKKTEAAGWLLKRLEKKSESQTAWWALGRLASRVPFYGSVHNLISKEVVQKWVLRVKKENWKQNQNAAFAAVMMARKTGDRARDLDEQLVAQIVDALNAAKAPDSWAVMLSEVKEMNEADTRRVFGEALPLGLKLLD